VSLPIKLSSPSTREFWEIPVLFEDEALLAIDKPAAIPVAPDPAHPDRPCLDELIHAGIRDGKPWAVSRSVAHLTNAIRLDSEATGVLLYLKNEAMRPRLMDSIGADHVVLEHVTLVRDTPADDQFEVSAKIAEDSNRPGFMKIAPEGGKKAATRFEVMEKFRGWTLLRCRPLKAQLPHQIRVHLSEIRHPIAGDFKYGGKPLWLSSFKPNYRLKPGKKERPLISAPVLHLERFTFPHPTSGNLITVESPWPKELSVAVKFLRLHAAL
jgi:RluA family pseudouridine synthase